MSVLQDLCEYYGVFDSAVKRAFAPECALIIDGSLAERSRVATALQFKAARDEMGLNATVVSGFTAKSSELTLSLEDLRSIPEEKALVHDMLYCTWKAALARNLAHALGDGFVIAGSWAEAAKWMDEHPMEYSRFFERCSKALAEREDTFIMVCDMLPLAREDARFQYLVLRALLMLALWCKGLPSIVVKVILTPEMLDGGRRPLDFVDASKLLPSKSDLWEKNYKEEGFYLVRRARPKRKAKNTAA